MDDNIGVGRGFIGGWRIRRLLTSRIDPSGAGRSESRRVLSLSNSEGRKRADAFELPIPWVTLAESDLRG